MNLWKSFAAALTLAACFSAGTLPRLNAQNRPHESRPAAAEQLWALANDTRTRAGLNRLEWDPALAEAAMRHCLLMAQQGPISHRYQGEPDLAQRTSEAGAHFSLIEENIAVGPYPGGIHQGWMNSQGHRENLLNPEINRVGIAVVESGGNLYAVADYEKAVANVTPEQAEIKVAQLLHARGLAIRRDNSDARAACRTDHGLPRVSGGEPQFVMRWQDADLTHLPPDLAARVQSGRYHQAEVGSCPAQHDQGTFTVYRMAVLLF